MYGRNEELMRKLLLSLSKPMYFSEAHGCPIKKLCSELFRKSHSKRLFSEPFFNTFSAEYWEKYTNKREHRLKMG